MNDDELRLLIRAAIQRHMGGGEAASARELPGEFRGAAVTARGSGSATSISFGQYRLERAADDTMCLIEPAVQCNHCGFCKCHGH